MSSVQQIELEVPALHPAQRVIVSESRRYNVLACGRRFGKSLLGIQLDLTPALEGYPVAWFSPTHKMLAEIWRDMTQILKPVTRRTAAQEHRLELITGGIVDMWSLDAADSTRGRKYKRAIVDEAAMVPGFQDAWQAVIRPTLTDYEGDAYWLSTPRGMNFFKQGFDYGQDPLMPDWASWTFPTVANPYIKPEEVQKAKEELPELTFKQEYLAEFLRSDGAVFRNIEANLAPLFDEHGNKIPPAQPGDHSNHRIVSGLDWGLKNDFTAHSIGCVDCGVELELDRFNQIDWTFQRERLQARIEAWKIADVLAEENSIGGPNLQALQDEGLPVRGFTTSAQSKDMIIRSLALAFEKNERKWLNIPVATNELLAYESKISAITGRVSYSAPEGMHDDTVIARALMNHAAQRNIEPDESYSYGYRQY